MEPRICHKRINLDVEVKCRSDGTMIPRKVTYKTRQYTVSRVLGQRPYIPREVKCKEPIEYSTVIDGKPKKLYYEYSTNTWFSIKSYLVADGAD